MKHETLLNNLKAMVIINMPSPFILTCSFWNQQTDLTSHLVPETLLGSSILSMSQRNDIQVGAGYQQEVNQSFKQL